MTPRLRAPMACIAMASALLTGASLLSVGQANAQAADRAPPQFAARLDEVDVAGSVFGVFAMPGTRLHVVAHELPPDADMQLDTGNLAPPTPSGTAQWDWRAPHTPGTYAISLRNRASGAAMLLNVFVKTPFDHQGEALNGYRIGHYEPQPLHDDPAYARPRGLVTVTRDNADTRIAAHFTLGDFLCHQQPDHWPKYLLVRPRLLVKLERIVAALRQSGSQGHNLTVMSGYRTPWYNADIDNTTVYSRHLYGGATPNGWPIASPGSPRRNPSWQVV